MGSANTLAYSDMETVTALKSLTVQAPGRKENGQLNVSNRDWLIKVKSGERLFGIWSLNLKWLPLRQGWSQSEWDALQDSTLMVGPYPWLQM
jgi:hypothetical protein